MRTPAEDRDHRFADLERRVRAYVRTLLTSADVHDPAVAEDIVQDVRRKYVLQFDPARANGNEWGFLCRVALNRCRDELKARGRRPGDYGPGAADRPGPDDLPAGSAAEHHTDWLRLRRKQVRGIIERVRARVQRWQWDVFVWMTGGLTARAALARLRTEAYVDAAALEKLDVNRVFYARDKVTQVFLAACAEVGLDTNDMHPETLGRILREEFGLDLSGPVPPADDGRAGGAPQ